ncbi:MAG: hypothetical protein NPIRA02_12550 [Nitrospirales bacterium]|nr:MAG: hypothetical protein NPIRA02_12550 [Nitrospirales bacterium]
MGLYIFWTIAGSTLPDTPKTQAMVVPSEVVQGWAQTFPHAPTLAVALTTEHFRDGRAPETWVEDMRELWSQLRFRYRTGQVQSGWTNGDTALVIYHATSTSIWGKHTRREEYRLIKNDEGQWLLNQFRLMNDQIL